MIIPFSLWRRLFSGWCVFAAVPLLQAQLAITEVMSSASINLGTNVVTQRPDFWELTNFGTNTLDLTGYRFSDSAGLSSALEAEDGAMFGGRSIAPNESIIFVRIENATNVLTAAQFRGWWGDSNLPDNLQIYFYSGRGFNALADAVQLWRVVSGVSTTLVDRVELYEARAGFTFTYDPVNGALDSFSERGEINAFKAVDTDDVGSPGTNAGPVALTFTQHPQSLAVDAGTPASFDVRVTGLPRPRFQWRFNGTNIPGATSNTFVINAAQPLDAGAYTVELDNGYTNGLTRIVSEPAVLQINTNPSAPRITIPPVDLMVTPNQTATFHVSARGYPLPTFQWQFNGSDLPGATAATLLVPQADFNDSGLYSVRVQNALGSTNAMATLFVREKPKLIITEIMGARSTNSTVSGRGDWWELTNFDTNAFNLRGYRFDDLPRVLEGAVVITNDVIIQPGESVLFIQDMTPDFFRDWWGEENLPEDVQFVSYSGNGISAAGDSMTLWNGTPVDRDDFIWRADYLLWDDYGDPIRGLSLNLWCGGLLKEGAGLPSVLGECGAIRAAASADIGSPGYLTNHPPRVIAPRALRFLRDAQGMHLTWKITSGKQYELQSKDSLGTTNWLSLGQHLATNRLLSTTDATGTNGSGRFYRLRLVPALE